MSRGKRQAPENETQSRAVYAANVIHSALAMKLTREERDAINPVLPHTGDYTAGFGFSIQGKRVYVTVEALNK